MSLWLDANAPMKEVAAILRQEGVLPSNFDGNVSLDVVRSIMQSPDCAVVVCRVKKTPAGFIAVRFLNTVCITITLGFFKEARGKAAAEFIRMFLNAIFDSGVIKITGQVASTNKACLRLAGLLGFKREGLNRQAAIVDGQVVDVVYIGITRGDWKDGLPIRQQAKG